MSRENLALQRYLERHIETRLPTRPLTASQWQQVLVVPAYRESPALLERLQQLPCGAGKTLVIVVLNRPDCDPDPQANTALRSALAHQRRQDNSNDPAPPIPLNQNTDLYVHDIETLCGATPQAQGVGLARKTGCDLALRWITDGAITSDWICSTDADATLPADYFLQLEQATPAAVAAVFPFRHSASGAQPCDSATALYELRLHHHVLGLEYAGSPYAYHSLGSCLAVRARAYAQVRGFPKRAAGEDFYLLNKLAKLGPVAKLDGDSISIQARISSRVPFGTGPAVHNILATSPASEAAIFYHPGCYQALRAVLVALPQLAASPQQSIGTLLVNQGLAPSLAQQTAAALQALGLQPALAHCQRQSSSTAQFLRQFHQWFDAFVTLKFIHGLRAAGWPQQSLTQLDALQPCLWPGTYRGVRSAAARQQDIARHWGWRASPE